MPIRPAPPRAVPDRFALPPTARRLALGLVPAVVFAVVLLVPGAADAATDPATVPGVQRLVDVISRLQVVIVLILFSLASFYGVLAAVYLTTAGGDPEQAMKGKTCLRNALGGYALAVLAPFLLQIVKSVVGG